MGTANVETYQGFYGDMGAGGLYAVKKRAQCELLRAQMETERSSFIAHWQDLAMHIRPRRARFFVTDVDRGERRNQKIIDSTATAASKTCSAGLMAGLTSPARPWFRLATPDPDLNEDEQVKEWCHEVMLRMQSVFTRSNIYKVFPIYYADLSVFGTGCFLVLEDDETVIRAYDFPIGTYAVANDYRLEVRTFLRTFRMTVQEIVEKWGAIDRSGRPDFLRGPSSSISSVTQALWKNGNTQAWIDIVHVIRPNVSYTTDRIDSRFKKFEEIYYELGSMNQPVDPKTAGLLANSGYDEFPVFCGRWDKSSEDVYGTDCPGMTALADIRTLQLGERRVWQAAEKMVNPPMIGPTSLRNGTATTLPGSVTWVDMREGMKGFEPAYQIKFDIEPVEAKLAQTRARINEDFYVDLFLMFSSDDRAEPRTATEIDEKKQEKLLLLGPMLENTNELLDQLIARTFAIMDRKGLIPPAPQQLGNKPSIGRELRIEYVSIMAQAQKAVVLAAMERFASFVSQIGQVDQTVFDGIDQDELVREYADATGIPPKILRAVAAVAQIRQQRAQQQQQQQAAENAPKVAGAANQLARIPSEGDNMLAKLVARRTASSTVAGTSAPPSSVAGLQ